MKTITITGAKGHRLNLCNDKGEIIATIYGKNKKEARDNAASLIKADKMHDELIEVLSKIQLLHSHNNLNPSNKNYGIVLAQVEELLKKSEK